MNGILLIEKGETTLVDDNLLTTLSIGEQQQFSYKGQVQPVMNESNPSFNLLLKFSFWQEVKNKKVQIRERIRKIKSNLATISAK